MRLFILLCFAFGMTTCAPKAGKLDFFRNTEKIFEDLADEAEEPLSNIYDAIIDGPVKAVEDLADLAPDLDWRQKEDELNKANRDAIHKDLKNSLDNVDFKPFTNAILSFLNSTRDVINNVKWDSIPKAANRIANATLDVVNDIIGEKDGQTKLSNNSCPHPTWIGDGVCDDEIVNSDCDYDGGDCCYESWYGDGYCDARNRHEKCGNFDGGDCDPKYPDCYKAGHIGNGDCDEGNLGPECDYDGGDCCNPDWYNDGECDGRNNNEYCEWDGKDCEQPSDSIDSDSASIVNSTLLN